MINLLEELKLFWVLGHRDRKFLGVLSNSWEFCRICPELFGFEDSKFKGRRKGRERKLKSHWLINIVAYRDIESFPFGRGFEFNI